MKAGRKPNLTFSEQVKLRSIQAAFGIGSKEEDAFWENVRKAAKLRREIRRGSTPSARPKRVKKYASWQEAHRAAGRAYYERNREKILEKRKSDYYKKKEKSQNPKRGKRTMNEESKSRREQHPIITKIKSLELKIFIPDELKAGK